jgi:hypothetical protein
MRMRHHQPSPGQGDGNTLYSVELCHFEVHVHNLQSPGDVFVFSIGIPRLGIIVARRIRWAANPYG